jgi:hypothetical protein
MSPKKPKAPQNNSATNPDGKCRYPESTNRHVYLEPGVQIDLVKDFRQEYKAAQQDSSAHNQKELFWLKVSSGLILVYVLVTTWQACSTRKLVVTSQETLSTSESQFIKDQRPYIWISDIKMVTPVDKQPISAKIYFANYGKSPAIRMVTTGTILFGKDAFNKADWFFDGLDNTRISDKQKSSEIIAPPGIPPDPEKSHIFTTIQSSDLVQNADELKSLLGRDYAIVMVGRAEYFDSSGVFYRSDFCLYNLTAGPSAYCHKHNEIH